MRSQFEQWQKKWDLAAEEFAKDYLNSIEKSKHNPTSWLTNTPMDRDYEETDLEADPAWGDIYNRSHEINGLLTEADIKGSKGEKKPIASFGGFTPTKTNPTQQSTIGADQEDPEGGIRVTPNWSDGDDLRELDDIKRRIEAMERKHHEVEVRTEKPDNDLKKQLESLRDRVKKLSEKINREPETDVT